jgi:Rrf2 family iron-sulfur cluster assembly transcriptional regulator
LISSTKGPNSGFFLSEENIKEPLLKVIESIESPQVFNSCILGLPLCSSINPCPLHAKVKKYRGGLLELISGQSIEVLAQSIALEKR